MEINNSVNYNMPKLPIYVYGFMALAFTIYFGAIIYISKVHYERQQELRKIEEANYTIHNYKDEKV